MAEPGVHFIPIRPDYADVAEKAAWCVSNDAACAKIGAASQKLIRDTYWRSPRKQFEEHMVSIERAVLRRMVHLAQNDSECDAESIFSKIKLSGSNLSAFGVSDDCGSHTCCEYWGKTGDLLRGVCARNETTRHSQSH